MIKALPTPQDYGRLSITIPMMMLLLM